MSEMNSQQDVGPLYTSITVISKRLSQVSWHLLWFSVYSYFCSIMYFTCIFQINWHKENKK